MIDFVALAKAHRLLVTRKCKCGWTFTPDGRYWTDHHDEHLGEVIAARVAEAKAAVIAEFEAVAREHEHCYTLECSAASDLEDVLRNMRYAHESGFDR